MSLQAPVPGLVIRYSDLWSRERAGGAEEGRKDRPCAIVLAPSTPDGETIVLPITHTPPKNADEAVEIPSAIKRAIGLDSERSWIVISEANAFHWPGYDLRPIPGRTPSTVVYGMLPPGFFTQVRATFLARERRRLAMRIRRDD